MKTFIIYFCLLFPLLTNAQITGDIEDSVEFKGVQRPYSLYVPPTYSSMNQYKLVIGLHGCVGGETPGKDFRDKLEFLSDSINAIILCPNGQPSIANGQMNEPDDSLILNLIDSIELDYNINPKEVYLLGFSCNGYITAKYGMADIYPFKGIIPFNGWITGSHFANNDFNYNTNTNVCICYGENDPNLQSGKDMYSDLVLNQKPVYLNEIPNIGHTVNFAEFNQEVMECFHWIESVPNNISSPQNKVQIDIKIINNVIIYGSDERVSNQLVIIDATGRQIYMDNISKENQYSISHLPKGIYLWQVTNTNLSGKFIR